MSEMLVCSVGTTEPWNVAGLGLDLHALAACGARGLSLVAGVSAQDGLGLHAIFPVSAQAVVAQFVALDRAPIAAFRIGALLDAASVAAVAAGLRARIASGRGVPIVYDPVVASSAGGVFAGAQTLAAIVELLLPLATIVTPNLAEAAALSARVGGTPGEVRVPESPQPAEVSASPESQERWGRSLVAGGARNVLVTGGHLPGDPVDVLVTRDGATHFAAPRLPGELRGTGCLLACALAAELGRGVEIAAAVRAARAFVRERFAAAREIGGMRAAY